jgi:hypothetical protein
MSEQIEPGDGWRLIDKAKDTPREGDQCFIKAGEWADRVKWYEPFHPTLPYRRRIPAKPEPFGVIFYQWQVINGKAVIRIDMERAEFNSKQARQLIEWLTKYVDWSEEQDRNEKQQDSQGKER